jgi:molybdopterin synthase catalytic subunit
MDNPIHIEILNTLLDINHASAIVADPAHGAINIFAGAVRNHHEGRDVTGITYDVHVNLAEIILREICAEAAGFWPDTRYYVAHYQGALPVGGISVLIAVSAAHRGATFEACAYVIDEIKKRAPVWKQEHYPDGKSEWLPGHSLVAEAELETACCGKCHG